MAAILSAEHLSKSYTLKKLLTDVTIYIGEHDRIGVVGVNGTGKSTLLKLLSGLDEPDGGVVMRKNGLRVSYLPQMPDYSQPRTAVQQVLFDAPKDVGAPDEYEAKALLSQFGIDDFDADVRTLSGGQKKRVALAAALIRPVDLLMLDEPTNHIDAETIALLEGRLAKYRGALMMARPLLPRPRVQPHCGNQRRRIVSARRKLFVLSRTEGRAAGDGERGGEKAKLHPAPRAGVDSAGRAGQKHQAEGAHPAV